MVKVGIRKPNLKSSFKARTTGRAKRAVKRAVIPGYGKKGMGWIKNPKKAAYNAAYSRTTVGVGDVVRAVAKPYRGRPTSRTRSATAAVTRSTTGNATSGKLVQEMTSLKKLDRALLLCFFFGWAGAHRAYARKWGSFLLYLFTFGLFGFGWLYDFVTLLMRRSELKRLGGSTLALQEMPCSVDSVFGQDAPEPENWKQRSEEETAARREFQRKNRTFMEENGVDIGMFNEEKVMTDALRTIESMCPCMLRFDHGVSREEPEISFCSPTRTGKLPKNVVEVRVCH